MPSPSAPRTSPLRARSASAAGLLTLLAPLGCAHHRVRGEEFYLAETVGLTLQYAVLAGDRPTFERMYGVAQALMHPSGLVAWRATPDLAAAASSSASIDDLTIARALLDGGRRWQDERATGDGARIAAAVLRFQVRDGVLVHAASWDADGAIVPATRVQTAYLDLAAFERFAELDPAWLRVRDASLGVLRAAEAPNGLFPEEVPLPGAPPDPAEDAVVNGIPVLYCALHLAQANAGGERTLRFFAARFRETGRIEGRYHLLSGEPVDGFENVAVYALTARLAAALGERTLARDVVLRMSEYWHLQPVLDNPVAPRPLFTTPFDNLHALIALRSLEGGT